MINSRLTTFAAGKQIRPGTRRNAGIDQVLFRGCRLAAIAHIPETLSQVGASPHGIDGIEIAAVVVWRVEDTAQGCFDVDDYESYVHLVIHMLKLSGLVIVGNCLIDGMQDFIRYFLTHPALDATILTLGDGTCIGARKQ